MRRRWPLRSARAGSEVPVSTSFRRSRFPSDHPLWAFPNVLLTPHVSAVTRGFWRRETDLIVRNLERYLTDAPIADWGERCRQAGWLLGGYLPPLDLVPERVQGLESCVLHRDSSRLASFSSRSKRSWNFSFAWASTVRGCAPARRARFTTAKRRSPGSSPIASLLPPRSAHPSRRAPRPPSRTRHDGPPSRSRPPRPAPGSENALVRDRALWRGRTGAALRLSARTP